MWRRDVAASSTLRLPRRIGWQYALELLLTGERIGAVRAKEVGIAGRVVPHDQPMAQAEMLARLTQSAPLAQRAMQEVAARGALLVRASRVGAGGPSAEGATANESGRLSSLHGSCTDHRQAPACGFLQRGARA